jgi:hypothetical protein
MSMNVNIIGEREVCVVKDPSIKSTERMTFGVYQTPTRVTHKILEHETIQEQIQAYRDWVLETFSRDKTIHEEDWDGNLTGVVRVINYAREHLKELDDFLEQCKTGLYDVEVYMT